MIMEINKIVINIITTTTTTTNINYLIVHNTDLFLGGTPILSLPITNFLSMVIFVYLV